MRILAYVPSFEGSATITSRIDADLPDGDFNVDYAVDKNDLGSMLKTESYDAVLLVVDASARDPYAALKNVNAGKLAGPLVCIVHGADSRSVFNILSHQAVSATDIAHTKQAGVIKGLVNNAYFAYGGRSVVKAYGPIEIDFLARTVKVNGTQMDLTTTEFKILTALSAIPGVLFNRDQLQSRAYDDETYVDDRTIDSHIKRLRKKLNAALPDLGEYIQTVYGGGYKFVPDGQKGDGSVIAFGRLSVDFKGMTVSLDGTRLDLTITEFMVLKTMTHNYPDAVARQDLVLEASKFGREADEATIGRIIYSLSRKLGEHDDSLRKLFIETEEGYALNLKELDAKAAKAVAQEVRTLGPIKMNLTLGEATFRGKILDLTPREQDILSALMDAYPTITPIETLAETVYGDADKVAAFTQTFIKLRAKLAEANDGVQVIANKRGVGYLLDIPSDARTLEKVVGEMDILKVGPWILNATRHEISTSPSGGKPAVLELNRQQYILFAELLRAYPQAATRENLMNALYGDEKDGKDAAFGSLFSQLKARVAAQIDEDIHPPLRKLGSDIFRLDLDIEEMTTEIMQQCKVTEVGAWAVNHTAHMFLFDGTPIPVTEKEFALMQALAISYPTHVSTETLADLYFDGNAYNLNGCLTGLRKKLRDECSITEALLSNIRGVGYVLNANRDELAEEIKNTFKTAAFEGFELNISLAKLVSGGKEVQLGRSEFFALQFLSEATKPMSAADIAAASKDEYTEAAIYHALSVTLKAKMIEAGLDEGGLFEPNARLGYILKGRRAGILAESDVETVEKISLNHTLQELTVEGKSVALTRSEYLFIQMLVGNPKIPLSPSDMAELGRELGETVSDATLKLVKGKIHKKLEDAGVRKPEIIAVKNNAGYYLACMETALNKTRIEGKRKTAFTDVVRIQVGDLELNTITDSMTYKGKKIDTVFGGSFDILCLMARAHRTMVTKADIALHFFGTAGEKELANAERGVASLRHMLNRAEPRLGERLVQDVAKFGGYTLVINDDDYIFVKRLATAAGISIAAGKPQPSRLRA